MQFIDGLMVSRIDPSDPVFQAAQGNGGIAAWVPQSIMAGMVGVVNTYVAQHLGKGEARSGPAYAWNAVWLALGMAVLMLPYALFLPTVFAWMDHSQRLIEIETTYARILIGAAFVSMTTRALAQFFYGLHRPNVVLVAALAGNLTNLFLNWVLIFGNLGAPALGVTGAAIATVIGGCVELAIPACLFLSPKLNAQYGTRSAWRWSPLHAGRIVKMGWPGALMFFNEMICWAYFMVGMVGRFGEDHSAASWIALRYMHLSFMPAVGISFAMTAIVGRYLGMKRPDLARSRARLGILLTVGYMGAFAVAFVVFRRPLVTAFNANPEIVNLAASVLVIAAVFQVFDALGITVIGILRGAGDTLWPGVVTVILAWTTIIGGGWAMIWAFPHLESVGPWVGAGGYLVLLGVFVFGRYLWGGWEHREVVASDTPPTSAQSQQTAGEPA
jgi:MATE family multidrug resistance protein